MLTKEDKATYSRRYYEANKERLKEQARRHYEANKEKRKEQSRQYYKKKALGVVKKKYKTKSKQEAWLKIFNSLKDLPELEECDEQVPTREISSDSTSKEEEAKDYPN